MWQAEADKELTVSAWPATAVGEQTLTLANRRYSTVIFVRLLLTSHFWQMVIRILELSGKKGVVLLIGALGSPLETREYYAPSSSCTLF